MCDAYHSIRYVLDARLIDQVIGNKTLDPTALPVPTLNALYFRFAVATGVCSLVLGDVVDGEVGNGS